jgi:hypothetical protein
LALLTTGPAQAQLDQTWVASNGLDANTCTRTAPCATFQGAIAKTAVGGDIACVDSGSYGTIGLSQSVTIDCHDANGFVLTSGANTGITVFANLFQPSDVVKTVRLRNINISGVGAGQTGILITGNQAPGVTVIIEDCLIDGHTVNNARGIDDQRTNVGKLIVTNTTIRNNSGGGISVVPSGAASGNIQVLLNNVRAYRNGTGAQFGNLTRVVIDQSAFTSNTGAGILTVSGAAVSVDRSTMSHNASGVQTSGGGTIALANSNIQFNTSLGVNISGGTVASFGNNRIAFNASPGTVPSPIGSTSSEFGQQ